MKIVYYVIVYYVIGQTTVVMNALTALLRKSRVFHLSECVHGASARCKHSEKADDNGKKLLFFLNFSYKIKAYLFITLSVFLIKYGLDKLGVNFVVLILYRKDN